MNHVVSKSNLYDHLLCFPVKPLKNTVDHVLDLLIAFCKKSYLERIVHQAKSLAASIHSSIYSSLSRVQGRRKHLKCGRARSKRGTWARP